MKHSGHTAKPNHKIRILLVDDHPVVLEGIRSCLSRQSHLEVVGEAINGRDAVAKAVQLLPDLVLMDINVPELNGLEATAQIRQMAPSVRVLALSAHEKPEYARQMAQAGASGYVLKEASPQELLTAIESAYRGETFFSPVIASGLLKSMVAGGQTAAVLTPREREALTLMAEGRGSREIADLMKISIRTVEAHRLHMMDKLNIHTLAGLVRFAIDQGLAGPD